MREPIRLLAVLAILLGGLFGLKTLSLANGAADWWSAQAASVEDAPAAESHAEDAQAVDTPQATTGETTEAAAEAPEQCESANSVDFARLLANSGVTQEQQRLLTRLRDRAEALNQREAELDTREALILAMEQRVDGRIDDLRELETQIQTLVGELSDRENADMEVIVAWYGGIVRNDAARAADRFVALDLDTQIQIASRMSQGNFSSILGEMSPAASATITQRMAARSNLPQTADELEARIGDND
jgi:flagellar motility protein MotE (MotC chaperone)